MLRINSAKHYYIRKYLLQNGERYHLTDLAKGGMDIKEAKRTATVRYERWYPLLEKEIHLLTKPGKTKLIAISRKVAVHLRRKLAGKRHVHRVLHYSRTVREVHIDKNIEPWREQFHEFSKSVDEDAFKRDFEESIKAVLHDACMDSYIDRRPEGGKPINLNDSRSRKLMFYYKNKFSEIGKD